jgi:hypothetical protein
MYGTVSGDPDPADRHPYVSLWRTRDLEAWAVALAPEVTLRSPLLRTPFRGRAAAIELFAVLLDTLDDFVVTGHYATATSHVFLWRAAVQDREISGVDHLEHDSAGLVSQVTVYIRPLIGLGDFAAGLGPGLASRRSPVGAAVSRLIGAPLRVFLVLVDLVASRLIGLR